MTPYQDVWVGGRAERRGDRECESRWTAIDGVLSRWTRPITMLDIGASEGYFSFRAAAEHKAVAVMIEGGRQLAPLAARAAVPGTIVLQHRVVPEELEQLAACEHFDLVLALNVLHHFGDAWPKALAAVLAMADWAIIETPPPGDAGACGQGIIPGLYEAVAALPNKRQIATTPSHVTGGVDRPMWLVATPKRTITRSYFDSPPVATLGDVLIQSTSAHKLVHLKRKGEFRDWINGINVRTYQRLGGAYPTPEAVAQYIEQCELPERGHGDVQPWNYLLDGRRVHLIDGEDDRNIYDDDEGGRQRAAAAIRGMDERKEAAR